MKQVEDAHWRCKHGVLWVPSAYHSWLIVLSENVALLSILVEEWPLLLSVLPKNIAGLLVTLVEALLSVLAEDIVSLCGSLLAEGSVVLLGVLAEDIVGLVIGGSIEHVALALVVEHSVALGSLVLPEHVVGLGSGVVALVKKDVPLLNTLFWV